MNTASNIKGIGPWSFHVIPFLNPLLLGYLRLPDPAACFHGFAEAVERTLLGEAASRASLIARLTVARLMR
jgi:hypothetical protein